MNTLLLLSLIALPADAASAHGLFAKLDRNADEKVTSEELTDSQRRFFQRALRVADRNEDGALSEAELTAAIADPKPVELSGMGIGAGGRRPNGANLRALDKNGDGEISLDEVPAPLKPRFEPMFERVGKKSLPIADLQGYLGGERGQKGADDGEMMESSDGKEKQPSVTPAEKTPAKKSGPPFEKGKKKVSRKKK